MKSSYGKGHKISEHVNVVPIEAMTGYFPHDYAVCAAMWTALKQFDVKELEKIADWCYSIHPNLPARIAKTCKEMVDKEMGYIYYV